MKVTRSYWLGLGSGLILSAMLILVISPHQGQAVISQDSSSVPPVKQQTTTQPLVEGAKQDDTHSKDQPSLPIQTPTSNNLASPGQSINPQNSTQMGQNFIVPKGASSERIANLLVAQGFIKDKESFLVVAHQLGVESRFRAGTFTLSPGLTSEELIHRLTK